jgi:hypothetical protein
LVPRPVSADDEDTDEGWKAMSSLRQVVSARVIYAAVEPSTIFKPISALKPGDRVLAAIRVSTPEQVENGNQADQMRDVLAALKGTRATVVRIERWQGDAKDHMRLIRLAAQAKMLGVTKVVFDSTCRAYRPDAFHTKRNPNAHWTRGDLHQIKLYTQGLELFTVADPDLSPAQIRERQTKRGQFAKGNKGGRPSKQRRGSYRDKQQLKARALKMVANGMSSGEVAKHFKNSGNVTVSRQTISKWRIENQNTADDARPANKPTGK